MLMKEFLVITENNYKMLINYKVYQLDVLVIHQKKKIFPEEKWLLSEYIFLI